MGFPIFLTFHTYVFYINMLEPEIDFPREEIFHTRLRFFSHIKAMELFRLLPTPILGKCLFPRTNIINIHFFLTLGDLVSKIYHHPRETSFTTASKSLNFVPGFLSTILRPKLTVWGGQALSSQPQGAIGFFNLTWRVCEQGKKSNRISTSHKYEAHGDKARTYTPNELWTKERNKWKLNKFYESECAFRTGIWFNGIFRGVFHFAFFGKLFLFSSHPPFLWARSVRPLVCSLNRRLRASSLGNWFSCHIKNRLSILWDEFVFYLVSVSIRRRCLLLVAEAYDFN